MLNQITIMGRLTRDPELRYTQSGTAVTSFTLAVERDFGGKDGGQKPVDFIDCLAWRHTAEFVANYFSKGRMAVISGRLQIRSWTDKDGNNRRSAEVVAEHVYFGDSKKDGGNNATTTHSAAEQGSYSDGPAGGYAANYDSDSPYVELDIDYDDLPF